MISEVVMHFHKKKTLKNTRKDVFLLIKYGNPKLGDSESVWIIDFLPFFMVSFFLYFFKHTVVHLKKKYEK